MMADLPTHAQQAVQRILDAEARRLLAEQVASQDATENTHTTPTSLEEAA